MKYDLSPMSFLKVKILLAQFFWGLAVSMVMLVTVPSANASSSSGKRVALVIGNAAYPGPAALRNPVNDATDMAAKLKKLGFDATLRTNVSQKEMLRALTEFGDKVTAGSEALFFYAGHGMQVKGRNYLIPIDAKIGTESSVSSEAVDVDQLLDKLSHARLSLVILDACRNNPFDRRFRGGGQGLAQINAPTGTLIAYATAPGKVAADGDGRNGLYTSELVMAMDIPGLKVEDVFKRVRAKVVAKSGDAQTPWESSSLTGDFYFIFQDQGTVNMQQPPADPEAEAWHAAESTDTEAGYRAYMKAYPKGRYRVAAGIKLDALKQSSASSAISLPSAQTSPSDPDIALWNEVKSSGEREDYEQYLKQYPYGRYVRQAKAELKKFDNKERAERVKHVPQQQTKGFSVIHPGKVFKDCADCPEMIAIPSGSFVMGSPASELGRSEAEGPQHQVHVNSLAVGKFHITRGQFAAFVNESSYHAGDDCYTFENSRYEKRSGRNWLKPGFPQDDTHPAVCISWNDAQSYVTWLARKTGKGYRLLSEAEWEYVARAGSPAAHYWGGNPDLACKYSNTMDESARSEISSITLAVQVCKDGFAYTSPVGSFMPNAFGLYDMLGNAWQWTEDCSNENYNGSPKDGSAWTNGNCDQRVERGSAWSSTPQYSRLSARLWDSVADRNDYSGFRVARVIP